MKKRLPSAKRLARSFTAVLRCWVSPIDMVVVVGRNRDEKDADICHTHDFCDANMAMHAALLCHGLKNSDVFPLNRHKRVVALINEAWSLAKKNEFRLDGDAVVEGWS